MPEMRFHIRWPDGRDEACYSPSTIIRQRFKPGDSYPVDEFVTRVVAALDEASERVRERFGMGCAQAMNQSASIQRSAAAFSHTSGATVTVTRFEP